MLSIIDANNHRILASSGLGQSKFRHLRVFQWSSTQGGVTPIDSIVTAVTALSQPHGQRSNHPNRCSQQSKRSQIRRSTFKSQCGMVLQFAPNLSVGVTHAWSGYFLTYKSHRLGLQFKYRDFFSGKISERSKVNGQKLAWSTVKRRKRADQTFDLRSQLWLQSLLKWHPPGTATLLCTQHGR